MKTAKIGMPIARIILILVISAVADIGFNAVGMQAGTTIDFQLAGTIIRLRPIIVAVCYLIFIGIGKPLITDDDTNGSNSLLLIVVGLVMLMVLSFPPGSSATAASHIYEMFVVLATSRLGLTFNVSVLMVVIGIYRLYKVSFSK